MKSGTRRQFLWSAGAMTLMSTMRLRLGAEEQAGLEEKLASDPMRPQFHLVPVKNWMNDPNGPIYFNGQYHMFFQYNPQAAVWGDMSWNHAVSPDMLHWSHQPLALTPTAGGPDEAGCFSGSAIAVGKRVYVVYTGVVQSTPDRATIRDGSDKLRESQCLAYSDDADLSRWTKLPEPIIPVPPPGLKITGFRDPSMWKQDDWYYLTVGSGVAKVGGCVLLYRSKDLKQWTYLHPLTSGEWNGKPTANPCDDGEMWECPEFFALDGGHVLIYSTLGKVYWQSGSLDPASMIFHPNKTGELDLGAYYAPKTQLDASGRRILWGWITEQRPEAEFNAAGWAGMMSLPRLLSLDKDGTLRMEVLPSATTLRKSPELSHASQTETMATLSKACGEVLCRGELGRDMVFTLGDGKSELLRVTYTGEKHSFSVNGKEIELAAGDLPTLHGFVDGSVIEMILSERIGYTKRFYYTQPTAPDIRASVTGAKSMEAWAISPISSDRLTSAARTV